MGPIEEILECISNRRHGGANVDIAATHLSYIYQKMNNNMLVSHFHKLVLVNVVNCCSIRILYYLITVYKWKNNNAIQLENFPAASSIQQQQQQQHPP